MLRALLISMYDLGRQPFGLASPAAWLREAGIEVHCADLAKERLAEDAVRAATHIGLFLPMHTATRLALPVIDRVREINPGATLIAYGLYAPLNEDVLRARGVTAILGGEFEEDLVNQICGRTVTSSAQLQLRVQEAAGHPRADSWRSDAELKLRATGASSELPRLNFRVPDRSTLLPLSRYATLQVGAERRSVGYTEASRGCKHRCRHCPIVPVYDGRFRVVAADVVLADIGAQVRAGARHITFGDPDFFNGPRHALAIVERLAAEFPGLSYDVTIKVEHLLRHAALLAVLRETGCAFVTSAVESLDNEVLAKLEKGHTRADVETVVGLCRAAGLTLVPTFVAFTPWTTPETYLELLHMIDAWDLVDHVAPIQLAIRLLIPQGSRMLELPDIRAVVGAFNPSSLTFPWTHRDPRIDTLQTALSSLVGVRLSAARRDTFGRVWALVHEHLGLAATGRREAPLVRATIPYLNEPWYC